MYEESRIEKVIKIANKREKEGFIVLKMPSRFFSDNVSEKDVAVRDFITKQLKDVCSGKLDGLVLPSDCYEDGKPMFSIEAIGGKYVQEQT